MKSFRSDKESQMSFFFKATYIVDKVNSCSNTKPDTGSLDKKLETVNSLALKYFRARAMNLKFQSWVTFTLAVTSGELLPYVSSGTVR